MYENVKNVILDKLSGLFYSNIIKKHNTHYCTNNLITPLLKERSFYDFIETFKPQIVINIYIKCVMCQFLFFCACIYISTSVMHF